MFQNLVWEAGVLQRCQRWKLMSGIGLHRLLGADVHKLGCFGECVSNGPRLHSHWHLRGQLCASVVGAVESVIETQIPEGGVSQKLSAWGKYICGNINPVTINSSDQVCPSPSWRPSDYSHVSIFLYF
ncbi:unnamed protein product [Sphagnum balticum]